MAYEESLVRISLKSDSSVAGYTGVPGMVGSAAPNWGKQFRFVKVTGDRQVGLTTAKTDSVLGVIQNKPQVVGEAASVAISGVSYLQSGAAVVAGAKLTTDATGRAITASAGDSVYAIAVTACAAADQLISGQLVLTVAN